MEFVIAAVILVSDLLLKNFAITALSVKSIVLIPRVVELTYVSNRGAAWGVFSGARCFFIVLTALFLFFLVVAFVMIRSRVNVLSRVIMSMLFAGAAGNFIDRCVFGYVRDMIHFLFIDFPVFNIADCAIVIAAFMLIFQTFFSKKGLFDTLEQICIEKKQKKKQKI